MALNVILIFTQVHELVLAHMVYSHYHGTVKMRKVSVYPAVNIIITSRWFVIIISDRVAQWSKALVT